MTQNEGIKVRKTKFIKAFVTNKGHISNSCKEIGIERKTYYRWLKDEKFKEQIDQVEQSMWDDIEKTLKNKAIENPQLLMFLAKTKLKNRGYVEKTEQSIEHKGEGFKLIIEEKNADNSNKT